MYTLKSGWEKFEKECLVGVTGQQHREAKVAFYAGVASILALQHDAAMAMKMPESEMSSIIRGWSIEMVEFRREMFPSFEQNKH